ncbi:hypothetical protein K8T06_02465 [bacterium]|nr:hypothetical protein [bacterium]
MRNFTVHKKYFHLNNFKVLTILFLIGLSLYIKILNLPFFADSLYFPAVKSADLLKPFYADHYYRPLITLTALLDRIIWGANPFGYHFTNLIIHVLNAFLVSKLAQKLHLSSKTSLSVAIVFLVHPVAVDSVAWIAGRCDLIAAFLLLSGVLLFLQEKKTKFYLPGMTIIFLAAFFSKEITILLPVTILTAALSYPFLESKSDKRNFPSLLQLSAIWFLSFIAAISLRAYVLQTLLLDSGNRFDFNILLNRTARFALWIAGTDLEYCLPVIVPVVSCPVLIVLTGIIVSSLLVAYRKTRWLITNGIIYTLPGILFLESLRYLYIPLIWFTILIGVLTENLFSRYLSKWKPLSCLVIYSICLLLIPQTVQNREIFEREKTKSGWLSLQIISANTVWPDRCQLYNFGTGQKTDLNDLFFKSFLNYGYFEFMLPKKNITLLESLDKVDKKLPLLVFKQHNDSVRYLPDAGKRFLDIQNHLEKSEEISLLSVTSGVIYDKNNSSIWFECSDSLFKYSILKVHAEFLSKESRWSRPSIILSWQLPGQAKPLPEQRLTQRLQAKNQDELNITFNLSHVFVLDPGVPERWFISFSDGSIVDYSSIKLIQTSLCRESEKKNEPNNKVMLLAH